MSSTSDRFTGRVKWFNNKAGYGFITVTDGPKSGSDIFVHHSSINVDHEQYKYLVQGEYIEFALNDTNCVANHDVQACDVSGIKGGKLMCETRNESREVRSQYRSSRPERDPERDPEPQEDEGYETVKSSRARGQRPVPTARPPPSSSPHPSSRPPPASRPHSAPRTVATSRPAPTASRPQSHTGTPAPRGRATRLYGPN
jgi:CspA family cold shock protein